MGAVKALVMTILLVVVFGVPLSLARFSDASIILLPCLLVLCDIGLEIRALREDLAKRGGM